MQVSERKWLLRAGDFLFIILGVLGSVWAWSALASRRFDPELLRDQIIWVVMICVGWVLWLMFNNLHDLRNAARGGFCARRIVSGGIAIALAYLVLFFVLASPLNGAIFKGGSSTSIVGILQDAMTDSQGRPPRLAPGMSILVSTVLLATWRLAFARIASNAKRRVIILGAGSAGNAIAKIMTREHKAHFDIIGFVDDDPRKQTLRLHNVPVLGMHSDLTKLTEQYSVDEVIMAISAEVNGGIFQAINDCNERGIAVTPMPLIYEELTGRVAIEHIGSQWFVALPFQPTQTSQLAARLIKRIFDLLCSVVLTLIFIICLPFIALAIKLNSDGPIFYSQERMGRHGKVFRVHKFRSMVQNAEKNGEAQWATKGDPRITRVGRFLRKSRLDELPQILNVLRGEMSMVGPRPERPQFIAKLQTQIPFFRTRLAAKPGLTGWAQINYGYGSSVEDSFVKLQYDLYYIKHQSLWFDLRILLRTVAVVLRLQGQ